MKLTNDLQILRFGISGKLMFLLQMHLCGMDSWIDRLISKGDTLKKKFFLGADKHKQ